MCIELRIFSFLQNVRWLSPTLLTQGRWSFFCVLFGSTDVHTHTYKVFSWYAVYRTINRKEHHRSSPRRIRWRANEVFAFCFKDEVWKGVIFVRLINYFIRLGTPFTLNLLFCMLHLYRLLYTIWIIILYPYLIIFLKIIVRGERHNLSHYFSLLYQYLYACILQF